MRLLVGLDERQGGRDALELARVLAAGDRGSQASALVVSVLYPGPLPMDFALFPEDEASEAEPLLELAREQLAGLELETRAYGGGSPAGILTTLAEGEDFYVAAVLGQG